MTELTPAIASAPWYAEQIADAAGHRAISEAGMVLQQLGNTAGDLDEIRERARQRVDEACLGRTSIGLQRMADALPAVLDIAQNGRAAALSTPWPDVDEFIDGIAPGRLIVVGARPGVGKSLMATNLALHVANRHGHAVHIASMEMDTIEVTQRLLANLARVNLTGLTRGHTDEASWNRIAEAHQAIEAMPLFIDDRSEQTVQHIRAYARNVRRSRPDLALIVVDYLQLMGTSGRSDNRAQELAAVSRGLKSLAREMNACVFALAQVNRDNTKRNDRPRQSDIRESGAIEADADQVILLHQPDEEVPEIEVIVDKNRHGAKGIRRLQLWGHYARLENPAKWRPTDA
jgi:replicative DNA helicase